MVPPNQHFSMSAKITKEDTGNFMKNVLYILWYAERHH